MDLDWPKTLANWTNGGLWPLFGSIEGEEFLRECTILAWFWGYGLSRNRHDTLRIYNLLLFKRSFCFKTHFLDELKKTHGLPAWTIGLKLQWLFNDEFCVKTYSVWSMSIPRHSHVRCLFDDAAQDPWKPECAVRKMVYDDTSKLTWVLRTFKYWNFPWRPEWISVI